MLDDTYLRYHPTSAQANYEEEIIFKDPNGGDGVSLTVVVRSDPDDFCEVEKFQPTYLGAPLSYTVSKGDSLEVDLLPMFCDYENINGNAGVSLHEHPELNGENLDIHISTRYALIKYTPDDPDFVGKKGAIFELCYDYQDVDCFNQEGNEYTKCPGYPQECKYFLYTYVEVEVTE